MSLIFLVFKLKETELFVCSGEELFGLVNKVKIINSVDVYPYILNIPNRYLNIYRIRKTKMKFVHLIGSYKNRAKL